MNNNNYDTSLVLAEYTYGNIKEFLSIKRENPQKPANDLFYALLNEHRDVAKKYGNENLFNKFDSNRLHNIILKCKGELTIILFFIVVAEIKSLRKLLYKSKDQVNATVGIVNASLNEIRFKHDFKIFGNLIDIDEIERISGEIIDDFKKMENKGWISKLGF